VRTYRTLNTCGAKSFSAAGTSAGVKQSTIFTTECQLGTIQAATENISYWEFNDHGAS